MSSEIEPPILMADGFDVFAYANVESLCRDIEPADLAGMDILCVDSNGLRLSIKTDGKRIVVAKAELSPSGATDGAKVLKYYLTYCKIPFDDGATFCELLALIALRP